MKDAAFNDISTGKVSDNGRRPDSVHMNDEPLQIVLPNNHLGALPIGNPDPHAQNVVPYPDKAFSCRHQKWDDPTILFGTSDKTYSHR